MSKRISGYEIHSIEFDGENAIVDRARSLKAAEAIFNAVTLDDVITAVSILKMYRSKIEDGMHIQEFDVIQKHGDADALAAWHPN